MKTRIYFLDNLRTAMIFLVILIHAGLVYEPVLENSWIVIDPIKISSIGLVRMYLELFVMFVLFFVSGYFVPNSVNNNSSLGFLKSKFTRILLPWIVAVFTLIPAYKAIFLYSRGMHQEPWFSYFHIFKRTGGDLSFFADNPTQNWLWFLPVLFMFQVIYLALNKTNLLSLKISLKTGVILTFVIGLIYAMVISEFDMRGWHHSFLLHFQTERLLIYFMVFLLGSLCNKLKIFESGNKAIKSYIISNIVLTLSLGVFTVVALNLFFNMVDPARNYYFVSSFFDRILYYCSMLLAMLSFLHILIHVFRFNLNRTGKLLTQLSRNSYQVYIIHMIVLGVIATILLNISVPALVKYLLLTILTFIISNIIVSGYHHLFQKNNTLKIGALVIMVVALFGLISYGTQNNGVLEKDQLSTSQASALPPGVSLHEAAIIGNIDVVQQHIKAGSNLDIIDPSGGSSPLITACVFGNTDVALTLIEAGADLNFKNNEGSTPLHTAAFFCRPEIVEALLDFGADRNIRNNAGSTALESVTAPFEVVVGIYDYFGAALGPLGLQLDYDQIKKTRPVIADMLSE